jgi:hypothetical protein
MMVKMILTKTWHCDTLMMQAPRLSDGRGRICLAGGPCRACVTGAVGEHAEPVTTTFSPLAAARPWRGSF